MYSQKNRPLRVTTSLGEDALLLEQVHGHEGLSEMFHFALDVLAPREKPIPFQKLLGQPAGVRMQQADGGVRWLHGMVRRVKQGRSDGEFTPLRLELVPRLWLLSQNRQCRIFQQQSVVDIADKILREFHLEASLDLKGKYQPRDFCVQYQESDFAFLSRLLEEEGIFYFFRHEEDRHVLVLSDYSPGLAFLDGPPMTFAGPQAGPDTVRLLAWERAQELHPSSFVAWDQCFELPRQDQGFQSLEAKSRLRESVQVGTATHTLDLDPMGSVELFEFPGGYAKRFDGVDPGGGRQASRLAEIFQAGAQTARLRMEEEATRAVEIHGTSNRAHLTPGYHFRVGDGSSESGSYLIVRVEHDARVTGYRSGQEESYAYRNAFDCLPAELPYRPARRTPRPNIAGVQTATVVGNRAVCTDPYGRVKVQFAWDRDGRYDINSSCWVRVAQVWAGKRWGAFFWPRPGQEVVVAFENGDPDQPLIVGSVYNAANMPPFELPQNGFAAGIKSCSLDGDPQREFNGVIFHDEKNNEHLQLHSQSHEVHTSSKSRVERTHGQRVSFAGRSGLASQGSGSGGGSWAWPSALAPEIEFTESMMGLAPIHYLNFVHGSGLEVNMQGSAYTHIMGGNDNEIVFDPLRVLAAMADACPALARLTRYGSMLFLKGGTKHLYTGSTTEQVYFGPKVDVVRGRVYHYQGLPFPVTPINTVDWAAQLLTIFLGVALYTVHEIADVMYDVGSDEKAAPEWYLTWPTFISSKIQSVLSLLDKALSSLQATEDKAREVEDKAALAAAHIEVVAKVAAAAGMAENEALEIDRRIVDAYGTTGDTAAFLLAQAQGDYGTAPFLPREQYHFCQGNYSVRARDISFLSTTADAAVGETSINIYARGQGLGELHDGSVTVGGSGQAKLCAGGSFVCATSSTLESNLTLHVPTTGTLLISQGDVPLSPQIQMGGIDPSITLSVDVAKVTINALGITLGYGEGAAGASITLNAAGITLQYGTSMITLNADGVSTEGACIMSTASLANAVTGGSVEITADEDLSITAPEMTLA